MNCPCCNATDHTEIDCGIVRCDTCQALFTTHHVPLGRTYTHVLPRWDERADAREALCPSVYFDFDYLSSKGTGRRHGWFNPETKCITQVG
jgi:hypothetical protein